MKNGSATGVVWLRIETAALCLDCGALFQIRPACPGCASHSSVSLDAFLNREQRYMPPIESDTSTPR